MNCELGLKEMQRGCCIQQEFYRLTGDILVVLHDLLFDQVSEGNLLLQTREGEVMRKHGISRVPRLNIGGEQLA